MGKRAICTVIAAFLIIGSSWSQEKTAIAILDFEAQGTSQNDANVLTERVRVELFKTDRYTVMERSRMREILEEQGFQQAVCNESECIIQAGHILGVQHMVAGSVQKIGTLHTISLRIVEVATGKVLAMASADCRECTIEDVALQATRTAVQNLLQPQSSSSAYQGASRQSNIESKYYGQLRLGVRELPDVEVHELGVTIGLQFGRELSRWFRVAASVDRFSNTYSETVYDQYGLASSASTKITYFLYSIILDLQIPLRSSWFRPYLGMGVSYVFLSSESDFSNPFGSSGSRVPLGKYEGVGFASEIGTEFRFSQRLGLMTDILILASRPESINFYSFNLNGVTGRLGATYHF